MPLTVITLRNTPPSLRGDLTKWMQEVSTGVYVGNFNTKIREKLWQRIIENVRDGEATICYAYRNEIGYKIETHNTSTKIIEFDGIPLVSIPNLPTDTQDDSIKLGFSKASQYRKIKKYKNNRKNQDYVVVDIETTGLDFYNDKILEIGAVKTENGNICEFNKLIKVEKTIPAEILKLTGIEIEEIMASGIEEKKVLAQFIEFIADKSIVAYGNNFDIGFLNQALINNGLEQINNKHIDLMRLVKKENRLLMDYKLQTVLAAYGIDKKVAHRAIEDARLTYELSTKVNLFLEKLKE